MICTQCYIDKELIAQSLIFILVQRIRLVISSDILEMTSQAEMVAVDDPTMGFLQRIIAFYLLPRLS